MDCCHSSSGTRGDIEADTAVRLAPIDRRKRPKTSFIFSDSEAEQLSTERSLAKKVIEVMPQLSQVQISGIESLEPEMTFKAVVTSLPLPPKGVLITGEEAGVKLARAALLAIAPENQPSLYLQEVTKTENAFFKLLARNGQFLITRPADDRPIVAQIQGYTESNALQAIERLEHITRWTNIAELSSPATSSIQPDAVQMVIYQEGQEVKDATISFQYQQQNGSWESPTFKVKLKTRGKRTL